VFRQGLGFALYLLKLNDFAQGMAQRENATPTELWPAEWPSLSAGNTKRPAAV
jgi:hypothetical protein